MASLHHPLIVNLAYAFQSIAHLVLVMDLCEHDDLSRFGAYNIDREKLTRHRLSQECVRFVAIEVAASLTYLHSMLVLYREITVHVLHIGRCATASRPQSPTRSSRSSP